MKFQVYVPESYTTYEQIEKGVWIPTVHETWEDFCKETASDEAYSYLSNKCSSYQQESVYALEPTNVVVTVENMARICPADEVTPSSYMGTIIRLFPGQRLFFAWLGGNPLTGLFDLPKELAGNSESVESLDPNWYAITPSGIVYRTHCLKTAYHASDIYEACQNIQNHTWLFSDAELHLLPSGKFGIAQEGLPTGIKFLDIVEVLDWATRTTENKEDTSCWNHVRARVWLGKLAKKFAEEHSVLNTL